MKNRPINHRVVIDTNVLVSALVFGGQPRSVVDLVANDDITLVMSSEIMSELRRIIFNKFPNFIAILQKFEKLLDKDASWVKLGAVTVTASRDVDDNKIIETALLGRCQYIISGDNDLLVLTKYEDIRILNPSDFLHLTGLVTDKNLH